VTGEPGVDDGFGGWTYGHGFLELRVSSRR